MQIFQRTCSVVPHCKWASGGLWLEAAPPALGERTGGPDQVGTIFRAEGSLPGPCFFAYLVGKDGICSQPPHFATAHISPTYPWTTGGVKVFTLLEACPGISSEVRWGVLI